VLGRVLTLVCGPASIEADQESAGHAITEDPLEIISEWNRRGHVRDSQNAVWIGRIIAFMAGAEAVAELSPGRAPIGDGEDRYQIALMLKEIVPAPPDIDRYEARLVQAVTQ
jgi:hypothetical protein